MSPLDLSLTLLQRSHMRVALIDQVLVRLLLLHTARIALVDAAMAVCEIESTTSVTKTSDKVKTIQPVRLFRKPLYLTYFCFKKIHFTRFFQKICDFFFLNILEYWC